MDLTRNEKLVIAFIIFAFFALIIIVAAVLAAKNKNNENEVQTSFSAGEIIGVKPDIKIPTDQVFYVPPCPLSTGLYAQSDGLIGMYPKNLNTKGFKVLIFDYIDTTQKIPVRKNFATVYQFSTCDNVAQFNDACGPYNRSNWELAYMMPYAGSAIVDGKTVHTYASYETRDRWPQGGFDCSPFSDKNPYLRSIYNTLTITEVSPRTPEGKPGECLTVDGSKQSNPDQILITFKRQKQRKEYTNDTIKLRSPKVEFDMSQPTKIYALDNRNYFDTDIDVDITNIILNLVHGFQVTCKPSSKPTGELPFDNNPAPLPKM
jgi:hypothetical protein